MNMIFSPKLRTGTDVIERWLLTLAQYILIALVVVLPIVFIPQAQISLGLTKSFVTLVGMLGVLIVYCLFVLRIGTVRIVAPSVLLPLWALGLVAVASALLSPDRFDALVGETLQIQTAAFFLLLALVTTLTTLVLDTKKLVMQFLLAFAAIAFLLQLWHIARIIFGPQLLAFGVFGSSTVSPLGSFNDVGIFSGLVLLLGIVALVQLPLRGYVLWCVTGLMALSLCVLMAVNFFTVWMIVGFFSLLTLLYSLTRDRLLARAEPSDRAVSRTLPSQMVFIVIGSVCALSILFIVAGTPIGAKISSGLNIQYVEVRPSLATTLDLMRDSYKDGHAFLGIGPNRFEDAWRMYKDPLISSTIFWNTNFTAGSSYIGTLFITLGVVGGLIFVFFLASLLYAGYRVLVVATVTDSFWYFVATASMTAATYLWGMSVVYVPGTTLLLLAAFWTGIILVASAQLKPLMVRSMDFTSSRPRAFILIASVMMVISGAVAVLFVSSKQFSAHVIYAAAIQESIVTQNTDATDSALDRAYALFKSDQFLIDRVIMRSVTLGTLVNMSEPGDEDLRRFQTNAVEALDYGKQAVAADATNPATHALLGSIYGILSITEIENARTLSTESFNRARALDPQNPEYSLIEAQVATRLGDLATARASVMSSLGIKPNYVDALFLLSLIDVTEGNTDAAIATAQSIITIEPQNPARYFQLGSLLVAAKKLPEAKAAFSNAVTLDPNFANARYLLALVLLEEGNKEGALEQLRVIMASNQDNESLKSLVTALESGQAVAPQLGITPPVSEANVQVDGDGVATTNETTSDGELIVPVNRSSGGGEGGSAVKDKAVTDRPSSGGASATSSRN